MTALKIVAAALAAIVVLLAAAAALLVWQFDPNDYKTWLTDWVEERTGRTLVVEDDLELRLFPWLAVEAGGITLGNAEGFDTSEPFATAERVAAEVRLLPLLSRRIEIGTVRLDGLHLNLARDSDGRGNWEDLAAGREPGTGAEGDGADGGAAWLDTLDAEGISLRDAVVHWHEDIDRLRYVASGIALETGAIRPGDPVDVSLAVDVLDVDSQRTYRVVSESGVRLGPPIADGGDSAVALNGFHLQLDVAEASGETIAGGVMDAAAIRAAADGRVDIEGARLTSRLPGAVEAAAEWTLVVFDPGAGALTTAGLVTRIPGLEAAWQLEGRNLIDRPEAAGSVALVAGSLDEALAALGLEPPQLPDGRPLGGAAADVDFVFTLAPPGGGTPAVELGPWRLESLQVDLTDARALGVGFAAEAELADTALTGRIDVPAFAPDESLLALIESHLPETMSAAALDRVALSADVRWEAGSGGGAIDDLRIQLLGADITGSIEAVPGAAGMVYRGGIASTRIDPARLARFLGEALPGAIEPAELGNVAIDTRFVYETAAGRATLEDLSLEAFGLAATGRAAIGNLAGTPTLQGQARVDAFSPRDLMRRFGQPVPDTSDDTVLRRASITTGFDVNGDRARFTGLDMGLDESRIAGEFAITSFDPLMYSFALDIDDVDVDRYLPLGAGDVPDDAPEDAPVAGDIELPAEALHNIRLDGRVGVGRLRIAGLDFQQVATGIETGNGRALLDSARANLYGGEFAGRFLVQADGEDRGLTLTGKATNLALEPIIVALTGDANFSGTGDFDLNLHGRGPTIIDNVRSASGDVAFSLRSGEIDGFNLGRALCSVYNTTQRLPAPPARPDVTPFEVIGGTATVRDGVASSPDLLARASFMDVTGTGSLVLTEQRLDYELEAKLTGPIEIPGCESMDSLVGQSIPLTLRGTVTDPSIRPDFSEIIERRLRDAVEDRLRERVQDRLRDLLR